VALFLLYISGIFVTVRNVKNIILVTMNLPAGYNMCIHSMEFE